MPVLVGGHNLCPLVEIGLTNLPKAWGAMAPPETTDLGILKKQIWLKCFGAFGVFLPKLSAQTNGHREFGKYPSDVCSQ